MKPKKCASTITRKVNTFFEAKKRRFLRPQNSKSLVNKFFMITKLAPTINITMS